MQVPPAGIPDKINMKLTFWGAAQQVTGSMFLLELDDDYRVLIDCGYDMEHMQEAMPAYPGSAFPFEASMVNVVLLTHAHIDHSGKIPTLYREGYEGQVLCTRPTMALTELLLLDSATINGHKVRSYHKRRSKQPNFKPNFNPHELYLEKQVHQAMEQFNPIAFHKKFNVKPGLDVTFLPAGHLLGAANILIEVTEKGQKRSLLFSGDIGRRRYPLLVDQSQVPQADYVICETTYGNRYHQSLEESENEIERIIHEACVKIPGRLIIPAFSVGRTQAILYTLNRLAIQGRLPQIKVFADSPLAFSSNHVYEQHRQYLNEEAQAFFKENGALFHFDNLVYVEKLKESKAISNHSEPCIIVSSSGMLEGGRIQHHIRANLENPYCTILFVGYAAEGTFGHTLINSRHSVRVANEEIIISARIVQTNVFSGHGDKGDLLRFIGQQAPDQLSRLFLVHGEPDTMQIFGQELSQMGYNVSLPKRGESFILN